MYAARATFGTATGSKRGCHEDGRPKRGPAVRFVLPGVAFVAACTASTSAVEPPSNAMYYQTGIATSPDDSVLFVANANANLQYDSGSISVLDLSMIDQIANGWTSTAKTMPDGCTQDTITDFATLVCDQKSAVIQSAMMTSAEARIGNFATDIGVQDTGSGTWRLIVPTRGDPSITWIDWSGSQLSCNADGEAFALCDDAHRLSYIHDNPSYLIPVEPFNVFIDSLGQYALVTDLESASVSMLETRIGYPVTIADVAENVFTADPTTGIVGATAVAGRTPNQPDDIVYVGSLSEGVLQTFTVGIPNNAVDWYLISGYTVPLDSIGLNAGASEDTRSIRFSQAGDRMYIVNRLPASLQVFDTSLGTDGFPQDQPLGGTPICRNASQAQVVDSGDGDRVYVSCFDDGTVWVIDPRDGINVDAVVEAGRGPYALAVAPTRNKLYVSNFLEQTVSVIDISPSSMVRNHVVLRIGIPVPATTTNP